MASDPDSLRKLHPKLRMIRNGSDAVNFLRSEQSSLVASMLPDDDRRVRGSPQVARALRKPDLLTAPGNEGAFAHGRRLRKRPKLAKSGAAKQAFVNVFIELHRPGVGGGQDAANVVSLSAELRRKLDRHERLPRGADVTDKRNFVAATVAVSDLAALAADPRVAFVHPAEALALDVPAPDPAAAPALKPSDRAVPGPRPKPQSVLVGIIDVQGFDFAHPDFLDDQGQTRFLRIWDQGASLKPPPKVKAANGRVTYEASFGSEITQAHMNAAIAAAKAPQSLPATVLEPQSQRVEGSHGTHVASIAAGRSGVCPEAVIAAVLLDTPAEDADRRRTFSDSTQLLQGVEYLFELGRSLGLPVSINISLGTNGGAHDGSGGVSRWIDALLATEGRSVCIAAGNAGQEKGETPEDFGWVMGRIHASGRVPAKGLDVDLDWVVVGDTIIDVSENELEIWYSAADRMSIGLKPPGGDWITVEPREFVQNKRLSSGTTVSIYNELFHPVNGANYIGVYLSPNLDPGNPRGVQAGPWAVRLHGQDIRDGRFHAWIERDDPFGFDRVGQRRVYRFPSFFSERSNIDSHSINSLACSFRVIAVANLDDARQRIAITSSQGPTRDDRSKPDIAAPGTDIVAAKAFTGAKDLWTSMSGTSMASPYVCGVVALMLAAKPKLTAAQCQAILQRTARPLPGAAYDWRNDAGFGRIDAAAALEEARSFDQRFEKS